jgi:peptidoglycan hydrolase CwlO-like protein
MDDIDVLSNVLLELKKRIDKQDEIIERLAIEKASLADKLEHLSQKIEHITSLQKQGEKNFSQYTKELENLKNFSKNLNKIIDNRFDEIAKSLEIEKAKEKTKDLENTL